MPPQRSGTQASSKQTSKSAHARRAQLGTQASPRQKYPGAQVTSPQTAR
jgi:hypothetical protein